MAAYAVKRFLGPQAYYKTLNGAECQHEQNGKIFPIK